MMADYCESAGIATHVGGWQIAGLVVRMAGENPQWRYTRIRGALANLGHEIARKTVKRILRETGIEPAPERGRLTSWARFLNSHWERFLNSHWERLAATDLFSVEVLTLANPWRHFVFFVIELRARCVHSTDIHHQLYGVGFAGKSGR